MRSVVGISCVQNETKQTKCAKTFQTVWLLCDRGRAYTVREENKQTNIKSENKQKSPPKSLDADADSALQ